MDAKWMHNPQPMIHLFFWEYVHIHPINDTIARATVKTVYAFTFVIFRCAIHLLGAEMYKQSRHIALVLQRIMVPHDLIEVIPRLLCKLTVKLSYLY